MIAIKIPDPRIDLGSVDADKPCPRNRFNTWLSATKRLISNNLPASVQCASMPEATYSEHCMASSRRMKDFWFR